MQPPELKAAQVHLPFPPERYLRYLTTNEVAALPKQDAAVIVVVAAIEQHGPHLPIATDLILGESLRSRSPWSARHPSTQLWVLPSLAYGRSNEHTAFAGTMTLSQATLGIRHPRAGRERGACRVPPARALQQPRRQRAGARRPRARRARGHGADGVPLRDVPTGLAYPQISQHEARWGTHAGEWETSMMLSLTPELVQMDRLEGKGGHAHFDGARRSTSTCRCSAPVMFAWSTHDITTTGAIGDPRPATRERGDDIIRLTVERCSEILTEIAGFEMPIPAGSEGDG